jgi:hypothetical protein
MARKTHQELRIEAYCERLKNAIAASPENEAFVIVEWKDSRLYGRTPYVCYQDGTKVASASGCGYDKESAVLATVLSHLFPNDDRLPHSERPRYKVSYVGGQGFNSLARVMLEHGYSLRRLVGGSCFETYVLTELRKGRPRMVATSTRCDVALRRGPIGGQ